jgi:hypothetical protein
MRVRRRRERRDQTACNTGRSTTSCQNPAPAPRPAGKTFQVFWTPRPGVGTFTLQLSPDAARPGCYRYTAAAGDYLSALAGATGVPLERLLSDNAAAIQDLDRSIQGRSLLICNPTKGLKPPAAAAGGGSGRRAPGAAAAPAPAPPPPPPPRALPPPEPGVSAQWVAGGRLFRLYRSARTWDQADRRCTSAGARLVTLATEEDFNLVSDALTAQNASAFSHGGGWLTGCGDNGGALATVWTGLHDPLKRNQVRWGRAAGC